MPQQQDSPLKILVVEDSAVFAVLLVGRLKHALAEGSQVHPVTCIKDAVTALREQSWDLIILDMHLPDANGLDAFEPVYGVAPEVPIVILSGDETEGLAIEAVSRGAQDYLIKGDNDTHNLMRSIRFAIERKKRLRAEGELQAAKLIQESLLPECNPAMEGFDVHGAMFPAAETAGDYFDYIVPLSAIDEHTNGIVVGDVSGKGVGAAMVMAETRGCLHSFALLESDLGEMMRFTNEVLVKNRNEHFITLMLGYIDRQTRAFRYASAGHQGWHISSSGKVTELQGTGTILGLIECQSWETAESPRMGEGDLLVIVTDGITEATAQSGDMFGEDRMNDLLRQRREMSAEQIVNSLRDEVQSFTGDVPQQDDMTLVVVKSLEG